MPDISVIVPVYQAERYLPACVESVRAQSFSDWELLLVDDGSTDGSAAICSRFVRTDSRVRLLRQPENAGVSEARNRGLREAGGETFFFLDADDRLAPNALETLWRLRRETGADTAACAHWNLRPDGGKSVETLLPAGLYDETGIREGIVYPLLGDRLTQPVLNGFVFQYLFDASIIRRNGLTFEGAYLEDELFLMEYFCNARSLAVTEEPLHYYLMNPDSVTHRYMRDFQQVFDRFMERKDTLAERYRLTEARPRWRENTLWAGLLIAVGNEYARGNDKTAAQKQRTVAALCARKPMADAIAGIRPAGMSRNKQIVAALVRHRQFFLLTLLYCLKNRK